MMRASLPVVCGLGFALATALFPFQQAGAVPAADTEVWPEDTSGGGSGSDGGSGGGGSSSGATLQPVVVEGESLKGFCSRQPDQCADDLRRGLAPREGQVRGGQPGGGKSANSPDPGSGQNAATNGDSCGNPIIIASGNKVEPETDFGSPALFGLTLKRTYNLNSGFRGLFGPRWSSTFDLRATFESNNTVIRLYRPDGSNTAFTYNASGRWYPGNGTGTTSYIQQTAANRYTYYGPTGATETYSSGGSVLSVTDPQGIAWTFEYTNPEKALSATVANDTLTRVVRAGGRAVSFVWTTVGSLRVVSQVTDPAGNLYQYAYNPYGLETVTYPPTPHSTSTAVSSDVVLYHINAAGQLLGKSINGVRYSTFTYLNGRATSSEHAGGVERVTFSYGANQTTVTNALGRVTTYTYNAAQQITGTNGAASTYCPATSAASNFVNATERIDTDPNGYQVRTLMGCRWRRAQRDARLRNRLADRHHLPVEPRRMAEAPRLDHHTDAPDHLQLRREPPPPDQRNRDEPGVAGQRRHDDLRVRRQQW